ncbi:MAG TPA: XdhC family protein [Pelovirga sp.]|nr:XdhC family protein [Pelovirga sp.]
MDDIKLYEELVRLKKTGRTGVLMTVVESQGSTPRKAGAKMLVRDDRTTLGTVGGGAVELRALRGAEEVFATGRTQIITCELTEAHGLTCGGILRLYLEILTPVPQLLVVGQGHIAQALNELGPCTGFVVTLLEPPVNYEAWSALREKISALANGHASSIVIACPGHDQDFTAARAALEANAGFVGVVGSHRKRKAMEDYLRAQGCATNAITAIQSPVGLDIGAETPAEIALSILAQLIQNCRRQEVS